ncbi:MAG: hypothetical protein IPN34_20930 [Planctomycetes bacterium]|nr:hypothetical protein [Planctomycetota bacterium]
MTTTKTTRDKLTLEAGVDKKHLGAELRITNNAPMTQREFRAAVLRLAAELEEKSEGERWLIHVERGEAWGAPGRETRTARIWIECATGTYEEEAGAVALLIEVAR